MQTPTRHSPAAPRDTGNLRATTRWLRIGAALAPGLLAACAVASSSPTPDAPTEIDRLIGRAECVADNECRTVGVGVKACGGPQAYQAWSTRSTRADSLEQAVARHAAARRKQIEGLGEASTCSLVSDPGARCERPSAAAVGTCELNQGQPSGNNQVR